ncbi:MAG: hypothetical protein PUC05_05885, partial [Firmicutes bacterium]|nr:hypothetical protein [Bacillota bacterium]
IIQPKSNPFAYAAIIAQGSFYSNIYFGLFRPPRVIFLLTIAHGNVYAFIRALMVMFSRQ